ncbi:MAG TPA: hypothetical protein PK593_03695 [Thermomicrobiales bacterium]|jgi:hypothetical protein|nr:hypothetical protein [Chloroflexota bacterium]HBY45490.1 hypothetical protein [Chloroflexota bacterium]HQX62547.1 hypothetical protein [Thermomicrobiales bacterium]HRA32145.1 hypothetical protein [Thermomicrobiales bacterium]
MVVRMICPQCGYRNEIGVAQCASCGRPFTRAAAERRAWHGGGRRSQSTPAAMPGTTATPFDTPAPPTRRRGVGGCFLTLLIGVALVGILGWLLLTQFIQPRIDNLVADGVRDGVRAAFQDRIAADLGGATTGEVTITEQEITDRINANGALGPIDHVQVHISPDGLLVNLSAYGVNGAYRATIAQQDGAIALQGGQLSGPLSYALPSGELEQSINRELAAALMSAGYHVVGVTLGDGELTMSLTSHS